LVDLVGSIRNQRDRLRRIDAANADQRDLPLRSRQQTGDRSRPVRRIVSFLCRYRPRYPSLCRVSAPGRTVPHDHRWQADSAFFQKSEAVFLPIFVPLQKATKIVRLINSQAAGSRIVLMAREAILKDVARLLLGVDSIAADSIAPNIVLLLQHYTPSCSYDDFDLGARCIETMMTAII
ncbi:hypothetical protein BVRB_022410, partial [Beta vulgaris subsp. vulgaris]